MFEKQIEKVGNFRLRIHNQMMFLQGEKMKAMQIQEALSTPIGSAADFDDDALVTELEELD
ncbi:putative Snf7 family protein [Rosa chinensis]|uniref:Putative Snf7 family protein n=1 Tax=Rosa chinensis TaxID=74649 RepID=A0A2P6QZH1_ROSCH|nr:putative Snf7 family protein [Rosa chinensis]